MYSWKLCFVLAIKKSSQRKALSSSDLSHSTLHVLLCLLERPSEVLTCSCCEGSSWTSGCPEGLFRSEDLDPFSPESTLVDLQHVLLFSCEWSLHCLLKQEWLSPGLISWLSCSSSECLSGVLFRFWLSVRWLGSVWLFALSECNLASGLCLCVCEHWVCSWESGDLSWFLVWFWWLWFIQKPLLSCSNSESWGSPMSRCISRFSSHSSSFEKEGLKDNEL